MKNSDSWTWLVRNFKSRNEEVRRTDGYGGVTTFDNNFLSLVLMNVKVNWPEGSQVSCLSSRTFVLLKRGVVYR
jgi:hypothetical protein